MVKKISDKTDTSNHMWEEGSGDHVSDSWVFGSGSYEKDLSSFLDWYIDLFSVKWKWLLKIILCHRTRFSGFSGSSSLLNYNLLFLVLSRVHFPGLRSYWLLLWSSPRPLLAYFWSMLWGDQVPFPSLQFRFQQCHILFYTLQLFHWFFDKRPSFDLGPPEAHHELFILLCIYFLANSRST